MSTLVLRDLREKTGELIRDSESGLLSVITEHGRPDFVAVPCNELVNHEGIALALAVRLFQVADSTLGKVVRLAGMCGLLLLSKRKRCVDVVKTLIDNHFNSSDFPGDRLNDRVLRMAEEV